MRRRPSSRKVERSNVKQRRGDTRSRVNDIYWQVRKELEDYGPRDMRGPMLTNLNCLAYVERVMIRVYSPPYQLLLTFLSGAVLSALCPC